MNKKHFLLLVFGFAMVLFACQKVPDEITENMQSSPSNVSSNDEYTKGDLRIISSYNGIIASAYACTDDGCYEIYYRSRGDGNIFYYDYATEQLVYLFNQTNSDHLDETDSSWLSSTAGGCYPMAVDDKLYLFKLNTPGFIDKLGDMGKGYILQMNLDGSDRRVLANIDDNEYISGCAVAYDGKFLYYLSSLLSDDGKESAQSIIRVDIRSGEKRILKELDAAERHFIVGANGGSLVLKHIANPVSFSSMGNNDNWEEQYKNQKHIISIYSVESSNEKEVYSWKQDEINEMLYQDQLIFWSQESKKIESINIFDLSRRELTEQPLADETGKVFDYASLYSDFYDDHILFEAGYLNESAPEEEVSDEIKRYALDMDTLEIRELTLKNVDGDIIIHGEGANDFLVQIGKKEIETLDFDSDGEAYQAPLLVRLNALISKEDYWNNQGNYRPFKNLVYENVK